MRFPFSALRVTCLVASAAASGYFWHGALKDPDSARRLLPREVTALEPPVIHVPEQQPGPGAASRAPARPAARDRPRPAAASSRTAGRQALVSAGSADVVSPQPSSRRALPGGAPRTGSSSPPSAAKPPKPAPAPAPDRTPSPAPAPKPPAGPAPQPPAAPPSPTPAPSPPGPAAPRPPAPTPSQPAPEPAAPAPAPDPVTAPTPPSGTPETPPNSPPAPPTVQTESRPGWGKGDENHEHTGPPGQGKTK